MNLHNIKLRELNLELVRSKREQEHMAQQINTLQMECDALRSGQGGLFSSENQQDCQYFAMLLKYYPGALVVLDAELRYIFGTSEALRRYFRLPPQMKPEGLSLQHLAEKASVGGWVNTLAEQSAEALNRKEAVCYRDSALIDDGRRAEMSITLTPALNAAGETAALIITITEPYANEPEQYQDKGRGAQAVSVEQPYVLKELLKDVTIANGLRAAKKKLCFLSDVDPELPEGLVGDSQHIKQILMSLLQNAIRFAPSGRIHLDVSGTPMEDERIEMRFTVRSVYQKQEDMKAANRRNGAVDLSEAERVAAAMDGALNRQDIPGKGEEYTLIIPQRVYGWQKLAELEDKQGIHILLYGKNPVLDSVAVMLNRLGASFLYTDTDAEQHLCSHNYSHLILPGDAQDVEHLLGFLNATKLILLRRMDSISPNIPAYDADSLFEPVLVGDLAAFLNQSPHIAASHRMEAAAPQNIRALVVDDSEINLIVAAEMLSQFGIASDTAESGPAAIEKAAENEYDIIFMDHLMLGMDGVQATQRIRALPGRANLVPVIALTANVSMGARDYFLQNGMNDYLAKPIELPQLLQVMEKWVPGWNAGDVKYSGGEDNTAADNFLRELRTKFGLDIDVAMNRIGGSRSAYANVLGAFARITPQNMNALEQAVRDKDWESFRVGVHGQKSSLANIGAASLSRDAKNLEQAAIQGNYAYCESLTASFCQQVTGLAQQITEHAPRSEQRTVLPPAKPEDRERFGEGLRRVAAMVEDLDADGAARLLSGLSNRSYGGEMDAKIKSVCLALELFDYEAAEAGIGALAEVAAVTSPAGGKETVT